MNAILNVFDRTALALINVLVVIGLPLAAFGLVTNAL